MKNTLDVLGLIHEAYIEIDDEEHPNSKERWLRRQMAHAYGIAIGRALELGEMQDLLRMLRDRVHLPRCMLESISMIIERPNFPQKAGVRSTYSIAEERLLCRVLRRRVYIEGMPITHFFNEWEEKHGIKAHTFKRIWRRHEMELQQVKRGRVHN